MKKGIKKKTYLLTRFGGIGDVAPVSVAAEQLTKLGHSVTVAIREDGPVKQSELFKNIKVCDKVLDFRQMGPWGSRCVKYKDGWISIDSIYHEFDVVVDFMNIIEGNSTCKSAFVTKPSYVWELTRNSNWVNWYDLHLAWVGIDPDSVPSEEKNPHFLLSQEERKEAKKLRAKYSKVIGIHPYASSQARTWYQAKELLPMIHDEYDNSLIIAWNPEINDWDFVIKEGRIPVKVKSSHPMRKSMIMLQACDIFIGADTGFTHVAEGLKKKHIAIYSTVPAWTRAKYYKFQTPIDPGVKHPEYYNFCIQTGDPLRIEDGEKLLTKREKLILKLYKEQAPIEVVLKELNCDRQGADLEIESLIKKTESWSRQQSKALSDVSAKMVLTKIKELLK